MKIALSSPGLELMGGGPRGHILDAQSALDILQHLQIGGQILLAHRGRQLQYLGMDRACEQQHTAQAANPAMSEDPRTLEAHSRQTPSRDQGEDGR